MNRTPPPLAGLAIMLAALAGFVDAIAWLHLGGFFAAFMSGNSTRLGVGLIAGNTPDVRIAGALILAFLAGVVTASVFAERFGARRREAVLALVTGLLTVAAVLGLFGPSRFALVVLAAAMGAENGVFEREGEVAIGLTYMTGTLVRVGQRLAAALMGKGAPWGWLPQLMLWVGFVGGTVMGARAHALLGILAIWIAAAAAAALTLIARRGSGQEASPVQENAATPNA